MKFYIGLGVLIIIIAGSIILLRQKKSPSPQRPNQMNITYQDAQTPELFNSKLTSWTTIDKPDYGLKIQIPDAPILYQNDAVPILLRLEEQTNNLPEGQVYAATISPLSTELRIIKKPASLDGYLKKIVDNQKLNGGLGGNISIEEFKIGLLEGKSLVYKSVTDGSEQKCDLYVLGKDYVLVVNIPLLPNGEPAINTLVNYYLELAIVNRIDFIK